MSSKPTVSVIVPVYRGEAYLPRLLASLRRQSLGCDELWLVVTDSNSRIENLARSSGALHLPVERARFDHAGTRSEAAARSTGDVLVFLTQDVLPAQDTTLETLVGSLLADNGIGAAYGRQIPDEGARPAAKVKRLFNYPDESITKYAADRARFGLRTPFLSNAFAAYRRSALEEIGGFGHRELICEDVCAGAALLAAGWAIRYEAEAVVHHTHHFNLAEEFRRYFDIGVAHDRLQIAGELLPVHLFGPAVKLLGIRVHIRKYSEFPSPWTWSRNLSRPNMRSPARLSTRGCDDCQATAVGERLFLERLEGATGAWRTARNMDLTAAVRLGRPKRLVPLTNVSAPAWAQSAAVACVIPPSTAMR